MSMRLMIGSSIERGRSLLILAIWSLTSLSARSMSTDPTLNCTIVEDEPSVTCEMRCQTPFRPATESSTVLVTCDSSSDGAAPDCVIHTCTIGMSMFGNRVIDIVRKLTTPSRKRTEKATIEGIGFRIDPGGKVKGLRGSPLPFGGPR